MTDANKHVNYDDANQRVAIFIDGSNLYHSLEENCKRFDLDFKAFSDKLCKGRRHFRTYYYNVLRDPDRNPQAYQDQQKFLAALYSTPYLEVRLGAAKQRGDVVIEKGVDIMLATDLLHMAWNDLYDVAIVISGDGDFAYALQTVKNIGKHVEIGAFPANLSWELTQIADSCELFTPGYFSDIWSRRRNSARHTNHGPSEPSRRGWRRPEKPPVAPFSDGAEDETQTAADA
ncbi:MAG: NYN domain-containing protein [Chloroflexi bacterium]|nr:NYN domain-containing protein [Chloroflexota bacterium]MCI0812875.1 NYN domain-containing protein [Chloroflexota bacterium]